MKKQNLMVWDILNKDDYVGLVTEVVLVEYTTFSDCCGCSVIAKGFWTEPQILEHWEDKILGFYLQQEGTEVVRCIIYL